jgi:hypothetical protein
VCGDLGEVALPGLRRGRLEQRKLEGAGIEQSADLRGPEGGDPVEPGWLQLVANAGAGDHAAVPTGQARGLKAHDQHNARQAEAFFELVDLRRQRHRVGGVAPGLRRGRLEHFDRHWAAIGRTQ